jgi:hypothetical protein
MVDSVPNDLVGGSCFGFLVRSRCALKFLRKTGGKETLEIREAPTPITAPESPLIAEWVLRDAVGDVTTRLYGLNGIYHFWTNDAGWFRIDPAARVVEISDHANEVRREQRLWGVPAVLCFMERGDFGLHAAAVEVAGAAILLAAPGRHGKTTLALAFHARGYRLLTEDTACCRLASGPLLLPGPTSVRLRPDIFRGEAPTGTRVLSVGNDRIHLVLDSDRAGDSLPVPIKALVFLRDPAEHIFLERVKAGQALRDLWALSFHLQNTIARSRSFSQLAQLAGSISVWNLHRPLSLMNLDEVVSRIVETCG